MRARLLLMVMNLACVAPGAIAATPASGTLASDSATVQWTGQSYTTSSPPVPDTFDLTIALPPGYWDTHNGGVEVAIRWTSEYNVFDLFVLSEDFTTIASATGFPTSAESLIMREPANGLYHVVVVPTAVQVDSGYDGIAQVELDTTRTGSLVPDLVPLPPDGVRIAAGLYSFVPVEYADTGGCYPDELAENPALQRCLRFNAGVANLGHGPFELRLDLANPAPVVFQDVYAAAGTRASTDVGEYTFHATHAHVHYQGFAQYGLYEILPDGTPDRDREVALSRKADFCMIDTRLLWFDPADPRGNGPRNHHFPQCNVPAGDNAGPTEMRQGIDVGWADVYTWDLPGQYIDITGVPDGIYALVIDVDPADKLVQLSRANDSAFTRIQIAGSTVTELP